MPVKYRITLLFTLLVLFILALVCSSVYYFSYQNRIKDSNRRLTNRAMTAGRLLTQSGLFDPRIVQQIDSSSTVSLKNKVIEVYDYHKNKIYRFSDQPGDSLFIPNSIFEAARKKGSIYFTSENKDVLIYHYTSYNNDVIIIEAGFDEEGINKLKQLRLILGLSFAGGVLITLIGGFFFSKRLLLPLRKITDEVNEISIHSLTRRVGTRGKSGKDEWFYLSNTLNQLLNRLHESFEIQGRFIANASHELNTPLTSISSQLEIALQRKRDSVYYENIIQSVFEDVQHLNKLTISLLEIAKASGSSSGLEIELIRIDEILFKLPGELTKANPAYLISLDFNSLPEQEESLVLLGNGELLLSALKNIVINACKYSSDHLAMVNLYIEKNEIKISVTDNGKGIPEKDMENIFQPFFRTEDSWALDGFGLGLPLSQRIIKLHKGYLSVFSRINEGTRIVVSLPIASSFTEN